MSVAPGQDVVDAAFEHEFASVHDGDAVADLLDLAEQVRAQDDGLTLGTHGVDHPTDRGGADGVDAGGGLVEDDEFRIVHDRLSEADALQHPFGVGADRSVSRLGHRRQAERVFDGRSHVGGRHAAELSAIADEFAAGQELMEIGRLREEAGAATRFRRGRGAAQDAHLAGGGGHQPEDDLQGGALAATVRPEQAVDLATRNLQGEIVDGTQLQAAEADPEILRQMAD